MKCCKLKKIIIIGGTAKKFLHPKIRDAVVGLYDFATQKQRNAMRRVLQGLYVCLVVVESRNLVNVQEFHEYNYETYLLILHLFPFLGVNTTIHLFLAHSGGLHVL